MTAPIYWGTNFGNPKTPIIGKDVTMSGYEPVFFDCQEQITIGDHAFLGHGVKLLTGGHDYTKFDNERQITRTTKPITIGRGAWVGSFAIVLGGVTIGEHAVVGAGSVVTKDVPAYEVWASNPAKFIKKIPH
jgi:maltose O-acetyltransferase